MFKIGFDNDKYIKMQSEQIKKRISQFGGKLYMEFGGKLFACFPVFSPTASLKCFFSLRIRRKS